MLKFLILKQILPQEFQVTNHGPITAAVYEALFTYKVLYIYHLIWS